MSEPKRPELVLAEKNDERHWGFVDKDGNFCFLYEDGEYDFHVAGTYKLVESDCTAISAKWCPIHGDCTCKNPEEELSDDDCPLHSSLSTHGDISSD